MTTATHLVPLESGDRMDRDEFRRRYNLRPDIKKAEWIEGVVYVSSPASAWHAEPHSAVGIWVGHYHLNSENTRMFTDITLVLPGGDVQPDICLLWDTEDEPVEFNERDELITPPHFVVEIAASSASHDLHAKLTLYEQAGVREYVVWSTYERRIRWFRLVAGAFQERQPDERGLLQSEVFPGLRLLVAALLDGDLRAVVAELER